jgi:hypothetical protein
MQDFVFFLGRFHVLALHLPIGIILAAVALDWTARRGAYRQLAVLSPFLWALAAASAVLTVVLGYMHFAEGAFSGPSATAHRFFGTSVAVISGAIWWLSRRPQLYRRVNVVTGVLALAAVTVTGHFGGNLTHGSSFLWQYAPGPLRALAGPTARPPVTSVAAADPYLDVVHPLLERRCMTCHNADKRENGFSMATYESTLAGGDTGHAIVPGKAESSELYRRINLAHDDEEFMPAEGKTPLTADQVKILRWWIEAGTPHGTTVGETGVEPEIEALIATELRLGGRAAQNGAAVRPVTADVAVVDRLYRAGFLVRQVSQSDAHLVVSVYSPGARIVADQMAVLLTAADRIVELDLQDGGLGDELLTDIGKLTELARLRLSRNALTDRAISSLATLPRLERLNLYANPGITDASVEALVRFASLRRLDVWQTGISAAGVARLRQLRPDLGVQGETATVLGDGVVAAPGGTN